MNKQHLARLVRKMYEIDKSQALDQYGTKIFGHSIRRSWRLFRHITKTAVPGKFWMWHDSMELVSYPKKRVKAFEVFATVMLHEAAHGWCYFYKNHLYQYNYSFGVNNINEEQVAWHVSRLVCNMLKISYQKELADLCYKTYLSFSPWDNGDGVELQKINKKIAAYDDL